jgi:hypothetical protein
MGAMLALVLAFLLASSKGCVVKMIVHGPDPAETTAVLGLGLARHLPDYCSIGVTTVHGKSVKTQTREEIKDGNNTATFI